uniref:Aryl hydrocarbon receptor 1b n=1 Tax=Oryzias sinensis TaxID=183150 RepID=A0A8C8DMY5_9TELE
ARMIFTQSNIFALNGFVLVITASGTIFYTSHTIQDYLGFHQTDVMHQSVYEMVHSEDQQELRRNLHWALNPPPPAESAVSQDSHPDSGATSVSYRPDQLPPENSSFLERSFVCRFRCLLDNSSGFTLSMFTSRLLFLNGLSDRKRLPQLALFAIATPLQPPSILEIRTKNMIFRTKHKLDFTPTACDAKGKIVLGYTEAELRVRGSGYQFIHAADMLHCAENHVRMIRTGESGLTVFRLLTKENRWKWVQSNARLVYKNGQPDYIIATQRDEEGAEHLRKRSMLLPFTYATGEALLYESNHPIAGSRGPAPEKNASKSKKSRSDRLARDGVNPASLLGALMSQDESVYVCQPSGDPRDSAHSSFFGEAAMSDPSRALEGLGLSAEDLELLLLEERMIRVEMDPERVPTLDDLLTNDEILSYIYDSIDAPSDGQEPLSGAPTPGGVLQAPVQQMQQHLCMHPWQRRSNCAADTAATADPCGSSRAWAAQEVLDAARNTEQLHQHHPHLQKAPTPLWDREAASSDYSTPDGGGALFGGQQTSESPIMNSPIVGVRGRIPEGDPWDPSRSKVGLIPAGIK